MQFLCSVQPFHLCHRELTLGAINDLWICTEMFLANKTWIGTFCLKKI